VTPEDAWLTTLWPFVRAHLPAPPASVVEIGCGAAGGFVPDLLADGYTAVGVDPNAPPGPAFHRCEYEHYQATRPVNAVIACASLHHVADVDDILDRVSASLDRDGAIVVVEWAWERFDEATALWCFARLPPTGDHGWLRRHRDRWTAAETSWPRYFERWAHAERLHRGEAIVRALDARFDRQLLARGPCFFPDLTETTEADEAAAIQAGSIQATSIRYVGSARS
jgi:hypothetical protein